jgi:hypothetical protein
VREVPTKVGIPIWIGRDYARFFRLGAAFFFATRRFGAARFFEAVFFFATFRFFAAIVFVPPRRENYY